jgi:hypothetical protein
MSFTFTPCVCRVNKHVFHLGKHAATNRLSKKRGKANPAPSIDDLDYKRRVRRVQLISDRNALDRNASLSFLLGGRHNGRERQHPHNVANSAARQPCRGQMLRKKRVTATRMPRR